MGVGRKIQARNVRFAGEIDIMDGHGCLQEQEKVFSPSLWKNLLEIWLRKYACKML